MPDAAPLLHDYPALFPVARGLRRAFHFYLGPTNSGKTFHALQVLQQASSGVYLAPLRLLAMEVRDRLIEAGVPCNLVTGEERVIIPGAKHTASTVEMMHPGRKVEVAVIDEIQMLQDPDRGSAWTAALIGVPARHVYVCGSDAVTHLCTSALEAMSEAYDITYLERKTPLLIEDSAICGYQYNRWRLKGKLQAGDAVIAFSRKDVLTLAARIRQWGMTVATIYGALSPEVRRTEAKRFASGEADILVATDAIGMGLNLPIRRVVFSTTYKFDGVASRLIGPTETRQIAGRAGRYGIYPIGYVTAFEEDELLHLQHMLTTSDTTLLEQLPIAPAWQEIHGLSETLHHARLGELLERACQRYRDAYGLFNIAGMNLQIAVGHLLDKHAPGLSLRDKFTFSCAPVSLDVRHDVDYFLACVSAVLSGHPKYLPGSPSWLAHHGAEYLEQAEVLSRDISLYAWLSYKFPKIFVDGVSVPLLRQKVSRYIEQALLIQPGYGETGRELFQAR